MIGGTDGAARGELSSLRLSRVATEVDVVIVSRLEQSSMRRFFSEAQRNGVFAIKEIEALKG